MAWAEARQLQLRCPRWAVTSTGCRCPYRMHPCPRDRRSAGPNRPLLWPSGRPPDLAAPLRAQSAPAAPAVKGHEQLSSPRADNTARFPDRIDGVSSAADAVAKDAEDCGRGRAPAKGRPELRRTTRVGLLLYATARAVQGAGSLPANCSPACGVRRGHRGHAGPTHYRADLNEPGITLWQ